MDLNAPRREACKATILAMAGEHWPVQMISEAVRTKQRRIAPFMSIRASGKTPREYYNVCTFLLSKTSVGSSSPIAIVARDKTPSASYS